MADEIKKTAIIDLQFDTADIIKRITEVKKEQEALKASTKELQKDFDKNSEAITVNGLRMKELAREEQSLNKVVADNQKLTKSQTGSLDEQRAKLALLTKQYTALSKEERLNTEAGKAMAKQIKEISDGLKAEEKQIGDTRREVGNYKDSIKEAFSEMGLFNNAIGQTVLGLGENLNGAIKVAKASFGSFSGFVKLNVVGALAAAGASAFAFFKATGEGEDVLERFQARAKGAFSGITQNFANAGKAARDAFNASEGFFSTAKNTVVAFNDVMTSKEAGENIRRSTEAYLENVTALQAVEDAERKFKVAVSESRLEIDRLLLTTKDRTLSDEQQIENLEKVKRLEVELNQQELAFARVRLSNAERLVAQVKDPTDALLDAVADAKVEINRLKGESALVLQQADNRISAQLEQQEAAREKDRKAREEGERAREEYEFKQQTEATKKLYTELDTIAVKSRLDSVQALAKDELDRTKIKRDFLEQQYKDLEKFGKDTTDLENQLAQTNVEIARRRIAEEIRLEQAKYDALSNIASSLQSLNSLIAGSNAEATEFGKTLASVQIAISAAQTIGNAIQSAKGVTGIDYILQLSIATAAALGAIAQVKDIFSQVPETPAPPQFYEGGYTGDGNPKEVSTTLGKKDYIYHKREYVIDHQTLATPTGQMVARVAESIRTGRPNYRTGTPGFYDGGFTYRSTTSPVAERQQQQADIIRIVKAIPPQEVNLRKAERKLAEMNEVRLTKDLRRGR